MLEENPMTGSAYFLICLCYMHPVGEVFSSPANGACREAHRNISGRFPQVGTCGVLPLRKLKTANCSQTCQSLSNLGAKKRWQTRNCQIFFPLHNVKSKHWGMFSLTNWQRIGAFHWTPTQHQVHLHIVFLHIAILGRTIRNVTMVKRDLLTVVHT